MQQEHPEPHLDILVDENNIERDATRIIKVLRPSWPLDKLQFKIFTNGITNKLVGVWYSGHYNEMVLVRVYGKKTDMLIDRIAEARTIRILHQAGYTHALYATFNNGLAYEFIEGEILTINTVRQPQVYKLVARRMAQMHLLRPETCEEEIIWSKTQKFINLIPKTFSDSATQLRFLKLIRPYEELQEEYESTKHILSESNSPLVFAHNDLLLANVIYNQRQNIVTFIDYEYTAYNYQAYDIANHFAEFAGVNSPDYSLYPDESLQKDWLKAYLQVYTNKKDVSESEIHELYVQVNKFVMLCHFFWGCWALIQAEHSNINFDYLGYAAARFNEYFKRKADLSQLK